jgi:hypothetical protein
MSDPTILTAAEVTAWREMAPIVAVRLRSQSVSLADSHEALRLRCEQAAQRIDLLSAEVVRVCGEWERTDLALKQERDRLDALMPAIKAAMTYGPLPYGTLKVLCDLLALRGEKE